MVAIEMKKVEVPTYDIKDTIDMTLKLNIDRSKWDAVMDAMAKLFDDRYKHRDYDIGYID